jgi:hypothetical protein
VRVRKEIWKKFVDDKASKMTKKGKKEEGK